MKKPLFALILFVLLGTSAFAKEAQQIVDEGSELGQLLVQRIKEGKLTLEDANTTITYGIDYYLEKLRKGDTKSFDNLSLFSLITADLKNYDATLNKPSIASGTVTPVSYTPSDVYFYDPYQETLGSSANSSNRDNGLNHIIIPPLGSQVYSIRVNINNVTKLPQLKIFAVSDGKEKSVGPTLVYYYDDKGEKLYKPKNTFSTWENTPSFAGGTAVYVYADIRKEYKDLSIGLNKNDSISLKTLTNFKYSITKVTDELENELGYIPFCTKAMQTAFSDSEDIPYYYCKYASMGAFTEGMPYNLFFKYNERHNYEYQQRISTSGLGDMYCKSGESSRSCLWIDEGKITSVTDYNW